MNRFQPIQVMVTSLTLALLLGGTNLYTTKQRALAETPDKAVNPYISSEHNKADLGKGYDAGRDFIKGNMPILDEASAVLSVDQERLGVLLKHKTLVEIASEQSMTEVELIARLQTKRAQKIDEAAQSGAIKAENADKLKANMAEHLKFMVNHKADGAKHGALTSGSSREESRLPAPDKLAAFLGMTKGELESELQAGQSLTAIAESKGISKQQFIQTISEQITPWVIKQADPKQSQTSS